MYSIAPSLLRLTFYPSSPTVKESCLTELIHAQTACEKLVDTLDSLLSISSMFLPYGSIAARTQSGGGASTRGFGSMDPVRRREVASRGGKASGGNFANNTARAVLAGRKGGEHRPMHAK